MSIYFTLIVLLLMCLCVEYRKAKIKQEFKTAISMNENKSNISNFKLIYCVLWIMILLIFAFRDYFVGDDTSTYKIMYDSFSIDNFKLNNEPVFWLMVLFFKAVKLPFCIFLFFIGFLIFYCFYRFIYKYSLDKFFSVFLFITLGIFGASFNGLRQFLALAFFVLAIDRMIEKDIKGYMGLILLAYLSHSSAIILFPVYIIRYIKINWKFIVGSAIICIASILFLPLIIKMISKFTARDYYSIYYMQGRFSSSVSLYNVLYSIAMIVCFSFLFYFRKFVDVKLINLYNIMLNLFFMSVCARFIATFSGFFMLVNRFTMFFFWSLIILIPFSTKNFFIEKFKNSYKLCVVIIGLVYYVVSASIRNSNGIYPYSLLFKDYSIFWWCYLLVYGSMILVVYKLLLKEIKEKNFCEKFKNKYYRTGVQCKSNFKKVCR